MTTATRPIATVHQFIVDESCNIVDGDHHLLDRVLDPSGHITTGDDGIGQYEYWGFMCHDSRPFATIEDDAPSAQVKVYVLGLEEVDAEYLTDMAREMVSNDLHDTYTSETRRGLEGEHKLVLEDIKADVETRSVTFTLTWVDC
jgi:hypothetical protein